jgi:hypothetical protein
MHAVNIEGVAYRSFRLVHIASSLWTETSTRHCAVNKKKNPDSLSVHLGPHRAAQKIFDAWCRVNHLNDVPATRLVIEETTRGKKGKRFVYDGTRLTLHSPRLVTVQNKKTHANYTITYAHQSKVRACKKSELLKAAKTTATTDAVGTTKSEATAAV